MDVYRLGAGLLVLAFVAAASVQTSNASSISEEEDALFQSVKDLVLPYGYPLEQHIVQTEDGYLLRTYRLPHGLISPQRQQQQKRQQRQEQQQEGRQQQQQQQDRQQRQQQEQEQQTDSDSQGGRHGQQELDGQAGGLRRPAVLLVHGLLDSCAGFLVNGPARGLAFLLADAGYDVWLGNMRGNTYGRGHAWLDATDAAFWAFSFDEMAAKDLPAILGHVLQTTGLTQASYVGHSQGTTVLLAAAASQPWLSNTLQLAVLLAPVALAKHITSVPLLTLTTLGTDGIFAALGVHEFLPTQRLLAWLEGSLCRYQAYLCVSIMAAICGYNPDNLDSSLLPLYLRYTPAGSSVQNMAHWSQFVRASSPNAMTYFDYGSDCSKTVLRPDPRKCNQQHYGRPDPPRYNLSAVRVPLALFTGGHDRLAAPLDIEFLLESLPAGVVRHVHHEADYEHLDFTWGINARDRIYGDVLSLLANASQSGLPLWRQQQEQQEQEQQQVEPKQQTASLVFRPSSDDHDAGSMSVARKAKGRSSMANRKAMAGDALPIMS